MVPKFQFYVFVFEKFIIQRLVFKEVDMYWFCIIALAGVWDSVG